MTRKKKGFLLAAIFALLLAACQFFGDLANPVEQSAAGFSGRVINLKDGLPVSGAWARIQGKSAVTDEQGVFSFADLETGEHLLQLGKQDIFITRDTTVAVTIKDTLRLFGLGPRGNTLPVIDTFYAFQETTATLDWQVPFIFQIKDSTDSLLYGQIELDGTSIIPLSYNSYQEQGVRLTKNVVFSSPGLHEARLLLWDWEKKPAVRGPVTVWVGSNRRPAVFLSQEKPFIATLNGIIQVILSDPDSNLQWMTVDWDDGGVLIENAPKDTSLYSHFYADTGTFEIDAMVHDRSGAYGVNSLQIYVKPLVSPKIDKIRCNPPVFAPSPGETLNVSIQVTTANDYVRVIYWSIITDVDTIRERDDYTDTTGGALPTDGKWFEHDFYGPAIDTLKPDTLPVEVYFIDAADSASSVKRGSFIVP